MKLLASKVPGATFEEKATAILDNCQKYRGIGFHEANEIMEYGKILDIEGAKNAAERPVRRKRVSDRKAGILSEWQRVALEIYGIYSASVKMSEERCRKGIKN